MDSDQHGEGLPPELEGRLSRSGTDETLMWRSLSGEKRDLALRRVRAFSEFLDPSVAASAEQCADLADLSLSRFYRMAREWEDERSRTLTNLGLGLKAPRSVGHSGARRQRKMVFETALRLVRRDPDDRKSVTALVGELSRQLSERLAEIPGDASLRSTVVEARRRRDLADTVGVDVAFDMSACAMRDEMGDLYVVGALVDRGTGIILGAALPTGDSAREFYRPVAADALARIEAPMGAALPWSARSESCEIVPRSESDLKWIGRLSASVSGMNVQPAGRPDRLGRYLRLHVGPGIGKLRLLPRMTTSRKVADTSAPKRLFGRPQAEARLAMEVDSHNSRLSDAVGSSDAAIPSALLQLVQAVAD